MDIIRKKKSSPLKKYWSISIIAAIATALFYLATAQKGADYAVERDKVIISTVKRGDLTVKVRGTGILAPTEFRWLAASSEGRVERILVKPGTPVHKGDLVAELSNPALEQHLEETRWELEALEAQTKAELVDFENRLLDQEAIVLNAKLNYDSSAMRLDAESQLIGSGTRAISQLDFEKTKLETEQFKQRWQIEQKRFAKMKENLLVQRNAQRARLNKMRNSLQTANERVENLQIRASINSVVQEVALEPGQQVAIGSNIARLARQDELIAELKIPEIQIRLVAIDQPAVIDTRNNQIKGHVSRIAPSVINGTVQVDVVFDQPLPADARPDLSVDGEIEVAHLIDSTYVRRPPFAQSHMDSTVFKLTADETIAERTPVKFGVGSILEIQVLSGLDEGDRIVLSDHSEWSRYQRVRLN